MCRLELNNSYVGLIISYVGPIISNVSATKPYVGLILVSPTQMLTSSTWYLISLMCDIQLSST